MSRRLYCMAALIAALILSCGGRAFAAECPDIGAPEIVVVTAKEEPRFDFSLSREALNKKFQAIKLPHPEIYHLMLESVMTGEASAEHVIRFREKDVGKAQSCVGFDQVTVTLRIRPVVYMASEHRKAECEYKALFDHEMRHVETDRAVFEKHIARMRSGLQFAFAGNEDVMTGPLPNSIREEAKAVLHERVQGAIEALFRQVLQERVDRQSEIDTYAEYAHLSNAC